MRSLKQKTAILGVSILTICLFSVAALPEESPAFSCVGVPLS